MAKKKQNWYGTWHSHPMHVPVHWIILLLVAFGIYSYVNLQVQAVVDTTPPTVSITYPTAKTSIVSGSTISISTSASDNVGIGNVRIIVSREDKYPVGKGTRQGSSITLTKVHECTILVPPYACSWPVPTGQNVTYLTQAVATDTSGNQTISKYIEFLVH